jgi:hypothetical protein
MPREISEAYSDDETARRSEAALLRALSTPHKRQAEMKLGRARRSASDPTILALRRVLDSHAAAIANARGQSADHLIDVIFACLPNNLVDPVLLPADGTGDQNLGIRFSADFDRYVTFAAEYWASLGHRFPSLI